MKLGNKGSYPVRCAVTYLDPAFWPSLDIGDELVLYAGEPSCPVQIPQLTHVLLKRGLELKPVREISAQQTLHEGNSLTRVFVIVQRASETKAAE